MYKSVIIENGQDKASYKKRGMFMKIQAHLTVLLKYLQEQSNTAMCSKIAAKDSLRQMEIVS